MKMTHVFDVPQPMLGLKLVLFHFLLLSSLYHLAYAQGFMANMGERGCSILKRLNSRGLDRGCGGNSTGQICKALQQINENLPLLCAIGGDSVQTVSVMLGKCMAMYRPGCFIEAAREVNDRVQSLRAIANNN